MIYEAEIEIIGKKSEAGLLSRMGSFKNKNAYQYLSPFIFSHGNRFCGAVLVEVS
jgi:hypothetical protein